MNLRVATALLLSLGIGMITFAGCGGGDTGSNEACSLSSDCSDSEVCVRSGAGAVCTINCTLSADECGGSASCEGVGSLSVNVCQEKKPEPSAENPPDPADEVYLPCGSDSECAAFDPGAVCAQWRGSRDCTIRCAQESECNPPAVGGIGTSFFGCLPDESDTTRTVCLPKEECFNDPLSCITGLPNETTGSSTGTGFPSGSGGGM